MYIFISETEIMVGDMRVHDAETSAEERQKLLSTTLGNKGEHRARNEDNFVFSLLFRCV